MIVYSTNQIFKVTLVVKIMTVVQVLLVWFGLEKPGSNVVSFVCPVRKVKMSIDEAVKLATMDLSELDHFETSKQALCKFSSGSLLQ